MTNKFDFCESILSLRRYLPKDGKMIYWQGNNKKNKGIYVDLAAVMGKFEEFIRLLKEEFPSNNILVGTPDTIIREIIDKFSGVE